MKLYQNDKQLDELIFLFVTVTKAEEKIQNIKAAIEVFEEWLSENGGSAGNKNSKTDDNSEKVDTVPGLGFKDSESARNTLEYAS